MVDKEYCMSSFLALRYIEDKDKEFARHLCHQKYAQMPQSQRIQVGTATEIDTAVKSQFEKIRDKKQGILLSGGMDSAILASYMPKGSDAYTFRFMGGTFQKEELERAEYYAYFYGLNLHYIDIDWSVVDSTVDTVMKKKGAPVHSIEPQIYFAAARAKEDGIKIMVIGDGADYVFGGMDGLLAKNWSFDEFYKRAIYLEPQEILRAPADIKSLFEKYRIGNDGIDFLRFYNEIITDESYSSYKNAFDTAGMSYLDPYERLALSKPLNLERIRKGESKYLIRELFSMKYPIPVPEKLPMPRPVDTYFAEWKGPKRKEFKDNLDMGKYTGNQKWLMYCLERFLNLYNL